MCIVFIFHRPLHKLEGLIFKMIFVMWPNSAEVKVKNLFIFFFEFLFFTSLRDISGNSELSMLFDATN